MKKVLLFISLAVLAASCTLSDTSVRGGHSETSKTRIIEKAAFGGTYVLTVDSIEYIVVKYSDGVAITFHRDLRK